VSDDVTYFASREHETLLGGFRIFCPVFPASYEAKKGAYIITAAKLSCNGRADAPFAFAKDKKMEEKWPG